MHADLQHSCEPSQDCSHCEKRGVRDHVFKATEQEVLDSVRRWAKFVRLPVYRDGELTEDALKTFDLVCMPLVKGLLLESLTRDAPVSQANSETPRAMNEQEESVLTQDIKSIEGHVKLLTIYRNRETRSITKEISRMWRRFSAKSDSRGDGKEDAKATGVFVNLLEGFYAVDIHEAKKNRQITEGEFNSRLRRQLDDFQAVFSQVWDEDQLKQKLDSGRDHHKTGKSMSNIVSDRNGHS